ncbi:MAG: tRNA uridine-5-carboxymethylaminomethyl(34) synthesis GTPase MnmE [Dehalococcoidia bacterium]|nr:tRNA uridine-5-carboxymethylaminomethyl(34) synthesis GTPase MnmE [Dehalococcoidia bacterium]
MYEDTIAAISTPIGEGGIGVVRLSGSEARAIAGKLFGRRLSDRRLVHGYIVDPATGEKVDEVLVAYMAAPRTYTREDVVEINCHGGVVPLQRTLELVLRAGARLANPGEFTLRAFLNGRLDLAQAEAVLDVIQSKTSASLRVAMGGLEGRLSGAVRSLREQLLSVLAYLTARIDFPEDEVEEQDVIGPLTVAANTLRELLATADAGMVYRHGVRTAIIGRPNVGKSSLLNCLLRENRAIVTPIPGTTRDTLEEVLNLQGIPFVLVDTAGITESADLAGQMGVERSRQAIQTADLILLVVDGSQALDDCDREVLSMSNGKVVVTAVSKVDLSQAVESYGLPGRLVRTSAKTGEGLADLERALAEAVLGGRVVTSDATIVTNSRHKEALARSLAQVEAAIHSHTSNLAADFVTIDLALALGSLGEITGETVGDDLLDAIFSKFCIGK